MKKQLLVDKSMLPYPTKEGGTPVWFTLWEGDRILFKFYTFLNFKTPEVWHYCDMTRWTGKTVTLEVECDGMTEEEFASLQLADTFPGYEEIYTNPLRPQLHFSFKRGILNDPNALFYCGGVYHMFLQHQPYTNDWGDWQELCNFGWGHAVSTDLCHWQELSDALWPDELGPAFSGTGLEDVHNVSGLQQGEQPPLLIYYTAAGGKGIRTMHLKHTQCLAYSVDGGRTFRKYAGNPIVPNYDIGNRDPKVFYHEKTGKWLMLLYTDHDEKYLILTSDDLLHFTLTSEYKWTNGEHECPNLFELPVEGENRRQMILSGVTGTYMAVEFDGTAIRSLSEPRSIHQGGSYQAMQLMPLPDGRQLSFYCYHYNRESSGFSNCCGVPNELTLYHENGTYYLHCWPMRELEHLYTSRTPMQEEYLDGWKTLACDELLDIELEADAGQRLELEVRGVRVTVDGKTGELTVPPVTVGGAARTVLRDPHRCHLRLLSDRGLLCLYEKNSHLIMPLQVDQTEDMTLRVYGRGAHVTGGEIRTLSSLWETEKTPSAPA